MRSKYVFLAFLWGLLLMPSVFSFVVADPLGPDLDITPGGSGSWQADGYYFGGTAYGTKTSFRPLHGLSAVTIVMWIVTPSGEPSFEVLVSQRLDASNSIRIYLSGYEVVVQQYNGAGNGAFAGETISLDAETFIVYRWDKNDNSGIMDLFIDSSGTLHKGQSPAGVTSDISGNVDLKVGTSPTPATGYFEGNFRHLAIYRTKLSNASIEALYSAGSDSWDSDAWQSWGFNKGFGDLFTQGPKLWETTQETGFDFEVGLGASWRIVQTTLFTVFMPVFEGQLNAIISLLGLIMIPSSTIFLAKERNNLSADKVYIFLFVFLMGWAFFIGGLVG